MLYLCCLDPYYIDTIVKKEEMTFDPLRRARLQGFGAINARILSAQGLGNVKVLIRDNVYYLLSMTALPFRRKT